MNWPSSLKPRLPAGVRRGAAAAAVLAASLALLGAADAPVKKDAEKTDAKAPPKSAKKTQKKLSGADLYAVHCGRCHAERYATEFTAAQWATVVTEMRVRANLPASQAKAIMKYLQEDSGTP